MHAGDSAQFALGLNQDANSSSSSRERRLLCVRVSVFFISFLLQFGSRVSLPASHLIKATETGQTANKDGRVFFDAVAAASLSLLLLCQQPVPCGAKSDALPFRVWPHAWLLRIRYNSIKGLNLSRARSCHETFTSMREKLLRLKCV